MYTHKQTNTLIRIGKKTSIEKEIKKQKEAFGRYMFTKKRKENAMCDMMI